MKCASSTDLRIAVGVLLILFSAYNLAQPKLPEVEQAGVALDAGVGVLNGLLGASTGLAGILPAIWCGLRGWPKDEQRAVFQPTAVATFLMIIIWFGGAGAVTPDVVRLFLVGLPALIAGSWLGWMLYGRLDEARFRKVVLVLLLVSGAMLVTSWK